MKRLVTLGGGGGHSQVLKALKSVEDVQITGICPSTDSGGSTGVLQREYDGGGYTGDLTKCIVALCDNDVLSKALLYRYENGPLHTHSVKNLLFHALEKVSGIDNALKTMWEVCGLGLNRVIPVTNERTELCASLNMGTTISGETDIDTIAKNPLWNPDVHSISDVHLKPQVNASRLAVDAVGDADYIIVCPGDLYSSIIPTLLPKGMTEAVQASKAKIILILNIMTKRGETDNYTATDFVEKIEEYLGQKAEYIVYNDAPIPDHILLKYSLERKVELGLFGNHGDDRMIGAPLVMISEYDQIYSSPDAIRKVIQTILKNEK
ncbi:MAG: gluconeogenesis factor YvcK family protein [Candidatus Paceibacterota bacterium]